MARKTPTPLCTTCGSPADGEQGLCKLCWLTWVEQEEEDRAKGNKAPAGTCCRCSLTLVEGFCPNNECPFFSNYQDEAPQGDYDQPGEEEQARIDARLAGGE